METKYVIEPLPKIPNVMSRAQGWIVIALLAVLAVNFLVINALASFAGPADVPMPDPSITFGPSDCPTTDPNWPGC